MTSWIQSRVVLLCCTSPGTRAAPGCFKRADRVPQKGGGGLTLQYLSYIYIYIEDNAGDIHTSHFFQQYLTQPSNKMIQMLFF